MKRSSQSQQPLDDLPATDAAGKASFSVNLDKLPSSTHPLEAQIAVRMAEPGGRAVEHKVTVPVTASGNMIGVKPQFSGRSLADGASATFDVVVVAPDGTAVAQRGLHYELLRIDTHYQFYKRDGSWNYEPVKTTKRVADGTVDTALDKAGHIALPVTFGRYRLEVSTGDANGPVTSVAFDAGFYVESNADTPDMLEVALDKGEYGPGDTMTVAVTARSAGRLTLNVIGDRLLASQTTEVKPGVAQVQLPVGRDWGTGAYLVATLRRPLDAPAQRMPGRAIGVQWFAIDRAAKTLGVEIKAPSLLRPNSTLRIPVKLAGLAAGADAKIVVAAVDVGILNLTNYKPPSPDDYYLGQRALAAEIRDLYGDLIDGMQGTRGQIRSGGDQGAQLQGSPPTGPPLALYSGIVTVGADGNAEVDVRRARLRRHHPRHGGGVEQGQGRPRHGRRHCARSGRAHGDAAALPAAGRPLQPSSRSRQCRGSSRRLHDRRDECGRGQRRQLRQRRSSLCARRSAVPFPFRSPPPPRAAAPFGST